MNIESKGEICDSNRSILQHSAISHSSIEFQMNNQNRDDQVNVMDTTELSKKMLKLELNQRNDAEKGSIDLEDEKDAKLPDIKSPKSPLSNSSKCPGNRFGQRAIAKWFYVFECSRGGTTHLCLLIYIKKKKRQEENKHYHLERFLHIRCTGTPVCVLGRILTAHTFLIRLRATMKFMCVNSAALNYTGKFPYFIRSVVLSRLFF